MTNSSETDSPFLEEKYVDELTGIYKGKEGKTKLQLQCTFLKGAGVPFIENARGRPIVNRSYFEGSRTVLAQQHPEKQIWEPDLMKTKGTVRTGC